MKLFLATPNSILNYFVQKCMLMVAAVLVACLVADVFILLNVIVISTPVFFLV